MQKEGLIDTPAEGVGSIHVWQCMSMSLKSRGVVMATNKGKKGLANGQLESLGGPAAVPVGNEELHSGTYLMWLP